MSVVREQRCRVKRGLFQFPLSTVVSGGRRNTLPIFGRTGLLARAGTRMETTRLSRMNESQSP